MGVRGKIVTIVGTAFFGGMGVSGVLYVVNTPTRVAPKAFTAPPPIAGTATPDYPSVTPPSDFNNGNGDRAPTP